MILVHVQKMYNIFRILIEVLLSMPRLGTIGYYYHKGVYNM